MWQDLTTPIKSRNLKLERTKKFIRKPASDKSERSSSRNSRQSNDVREKFIKSPSMKNDSTEKHKNFFQSLATETVFSTAKRALYPETPRNKQFYNLGEFQKSRLTNTNNQLTIGTLESQIELKNHEVTVLSGQCCRIKLQLEDEKEKRQKVEQQKKSLSKQLKETVKILDSMKIEIKKIEKQKEYLIKQVQFLEKINYDDNTRDMQSYREQFLNNQIERLHLELKKSKEGREEELLAELKKNQEDKYTLDSHYRAMKIANQCLIKQLNQNNDDVHEIILNSEQYIKLREKYIKFLDEYKQLRNQYWTMKAQLITQKNEHQNSSLFNITASDMDISLNQKSIQSH